jgi:type II secretory pathway pseudopilin PulG
MRPLPSHRVSASDRRRSGFTLLEAALTTVIIGVGGVAMLQLLASGTAANGEGTSLTMAMNLAGNVRECLTGVAFSDPTVQDNWGPELGETLSSYNDLDDFDGVKFSPPIDARRNPLGNEFADWSQTITVQSVDVDDLRTVIPHLTHKPADRPTSRVTVSVQRHGKTLFTQSWVVGYLNP